MKNKEKLFTILTSCPDEVIHIHEFSIHAIVGFVT